MTRVSPLASVAVIGAGAWGTALANVSARADRTVRLWGRDEAHIADMLASRENKRHLPGIPLDKNVQPTADLALAADADILLVSVPAQALRGMLVALSDKLRVGATLVLCAKGFERSTGHFLSDVAKEILPHHKVAVLSGPSFAVDVSRGLPTAVTLAADDLDLARDLTQVLSGQTFRLYHSKDMRGVEIGGAAKNVLAIACGIAHGRGLGASAGAALIARGFAELSRFGKAWGAQSETLMGLSGLGDLVLTCSSSQSRNFSFGIGLGKGESPLEAGHGKLAEGSFTASVLIEMARQRGVDMPIAQSVAAVLAGTLSVDGAIESLMSRPTRAEINE